MSTDAIKLYQVLILFFDYFLSEYIIKTLISSRAVCPAIILAHLSSLFVEMVVACESVGFVT